MDSCRRIISSLLCAVVICLGSGALDLARADALAEGFTSPPDSARPWVYWFWLDGNITREGITADLEAMRRVGIGGVLIMEVAQGIPPGPARLMSTQWRELFKHVAAEASRLGIEVNMNNDAGWCGSGGPWVKPEQAMQKVVWSETHVQVGDGAPRASPRRFEGILPQPRMIADSYRDIAVLAFPTLDGDDVRMADFSPKLTASVSDDIFRGGKLLLDGNPATGVPFPKPVPGKPQYVQFEFSQPYTARSLSLAISGPRQSQQGVVQASNDGREFKTIRQFNVQTPGASLNFDKVSVRYYKIVFTRSDLRADRLPLAEVELSPKYRIENFQGKAGFIRQQFPAHAPESILPPELVIGRDRIVDLSVRMEKNGRLVWDVPQGKWTLLRLGHTPTGAKNAPSPKEGQGLECDKFSKGAIEAHFSGFMGKLLDDAGPSGRKALKYTHIDSWEVGSQNWSSRFREEFQKRRGYDPLPFLPVMTGRVVESMEVSERFLWDLRRTCGDLLNENYAGRLQELARQNGMKLSIEAYGDGPTENLAYAGRANMPMGEFWVGGGASASCRAMASAAHVYGKPIVGAESFTAVPEHARWTNHPFSLKPLGDLIFCEGINRFVFHRYAMQPWLDRKPGMTMGPWGVHYERTETWWEQTGPWHEYLSRCQYMLQQGRFVADVCYLSGEGSPNDLPGRAGLNPVTPPGYDYDGCPPELALNGMSVKEGRLVLPSGMSYRVLVLPPGDAMTPTLLRKIKDLVEAGATVIGQRPVKSPSLADYPKCDDEVKALAAELWSDCDGKAITEHRCGHGRIVWGKPMEEVLTALGVPPDFRCREKGVPVHYIHRAIGDSDVFFVASGVPLPVEVHCSFRVRGKRPELWWPDSGRIESVAVYDERDGLISMPIRFEPCGSVFVVFHKGAERFDPVVTVARDGRQITPLPERKPKIVVQKAVYGVLGDPQCTRDVRAKVQQVVDGGEYSFQVALMAKGDDPAFGIVKTLIVDYTADGRKLTAAGKDPETISLEIGIPSEHVADIHRNADGRLVVEAWQPGRYELRTASGRTLQADIPTVPQPQEIGGPWELRFPRKWGAPEHVTLDRLISWTEHSDPGVKYFSGTATYRKVFVLSEQSKIQNLKSKIYLDLGRMEVIAQVRLNERDLGILWKPPFLVDITDAVNVGDNTLEVTVTNLWPNRLIGDEQLPDDCEWNEPGRLGGSAIKEWPQWLLEGKPSPTGRYTFTTWKHWTKDSPLLESGLLGPVEIRAVREIVVTP
jgi:hypothetical protein